MYWPVGATTVVLFRVTLEKLIINTYNTYDSAGCIGLDTTSIAADRLKGCVANTLVEVLLPDEECYLDSG